jgi:hypothetical protein
MRSPGCARPACPCGRSAVRTGRSPSTITGSWPATPIPHRGTCRSGRTGWPWERSGGRSGLSGPRPGAARAGAAAAGPRYSPEQASGRLKVEHPGRPAMRVSHETIYQGIYVYPRGSSARAAGSPAVRAGRAAPPRPPRDARPDRRGVPIGQRPPEAEGRLVPGHHEGDLIMGSRASNSAVGTIVERMTGLPDPAAPAGRARRRRRRRRRHRRMTALPAWFTRTLTWDPRLGDGPPQHVTDATGIAACTSPTRTLPGSAAATRHQRPAPPVLPKDTDLPPGPPPSSMHIADELNDPAPQALRLPHPPRATR